MKFQYCSDLHLEFPVNKKYLKANPIKPGAETLLLAGDIIPFIELEKENEFFNFLSDSFEHTYWIPGNHEYYRSDITERTGTFHEKIRSNVSLLNNSVIEHNGVRLLFSTLWSKINPTFEYLIKKSMADFHLIKNKGKKISGDDYDQLHEDCRAFLVKEWSTVRNLKTIVVTHHLPTLLNYPEKYRDSELNLAFATELFDLIEASNADYWIFGHSHEVVPDFKIGKTTLTTNQLGYVEYGEHLNFKNPEVIT
ncbi:metallophosphoesterase [Chryseosolibacter indicus]|uniref:Metallophosphoesterase n=1 Tax=Chryseosolibacter indicus TaxID=2782351 RepID=A0ABS5VVB4_9BACT|nr:metallophosphoesterase [Chryseosolibacter indicus]MBT1705276.1 metallophosphoesterase [Chryseosolibacter indicus]